MITQAITNTITVSKLVKAESQKCEQADKLSSLNVEELPTYIQPLSDSETGFITLSEILNIINSLVFYYCLVFFIFQYNHYNYIIFLFVDIPLIFTSILFCHVMNNDIKKFEIFSILIFSIVSLTISKVISNLSMSPYVPLTKSIINYITLNYCVFCIPFLLIMKYNENSCYSSSLPTKLFYMILAFIMSCIDYGFINKMRCVFYAINFFEFLPIIRKNISKNSKTKNIFSYFIFNSYLLGLLCYMGKFSLILVLIIGNILFIILSYLFTQLALTV